MFALIFDAVPRFALFSNLYVVSSAEEQNKVIDRVCEHVEQLWAAETQKQQALKHKEVYCFCS